MDEKLLKAARRAVDVMTGKVAHDFEGYCPDETDWKRRDKSCSACKRIIALEAAIKEARGK